MMLFIVIAIVAFIYYLWKQNNGNSTFFNTQASSHHDPETLSDEELAQHKERLEAEFNRRHQSERLEKELAELRLQLAELKQAKES